MLPGPYAIPSARATITGYYTNAMPTSVYRGAGRPEAAGALERAVDQAAAELRIDPAELRRRNVIAAFPHRTATGATYDSGRYETALDKALELADYKHWRDEQRRLRAEGRHVGIGIATFVEPAGNGLWDSGLVRVDSSGGVTVITGATPHGQGHATTWAQIVADELAIPMERILVLTGDTAVVPLGSGTYAGRSVTVAGSAITVAARAVRDKMQAIAAEMIEARPEDVELADGVFQVVGTPGRSVSFDRVAATAHARAGTPGLPRGLDHLEVFELADMSYPFGTHVAVVEVEAETGEVRFLRYAGVDDCGTVINPLLVEGQMHGGLVQGLGQVLFEEIKYDPDSAQLLTGSLMDYALPRASHIPDMHLDFMETPTPLTPLGAKGVGEAGTIAFPVAVYNAVADALAPLGVRNLEMPLTPPKVWAAMHSVSH